MGCAPVSNETRRYLFQELGSTTALLNRGIARNDVRQYRPQPARGAAPPRAFHSAPIILRSARTCRMSASFRLLSNRCGSARAIFRGRSRQFCLMAPTVSSIALSIWSLPVVAAFVLTQWDLVMDAPNAFDRRPSCPDLSHEHRRDSHGRAVEMTLSSLLVEDCRPAATSIAL
jgi:hypothetical protein